MNGCQQSPPSAELLRCYLPHLVEVEEPPDRGVVRSDDAPLRLGLLLARLGPHPGVRGLGLGEAHLPLGPRAPVCTGDTVRSENSIMWNRGYIVSIDSGVAGYLIHVNKAFL